jgi:hypothetical protein
MSPEFPLPPVHNPEKQEKGLTPERLRQLQTLEITAQADFSPVLEKINQDLGVKLEPRTGCFHVTIISPTESKLIATLTAEQIAELERISQQVQKGQGIKIRGIGYIDGASTENLREVDKVKKACFLALEIPELDAFRSSLRLPKKDFHVTLGFEGGDIHMAITGTDEKGKAVLGHISKKADPRFEDYAKELPPISFSSLGGQEKQQKQAK